VVGSCLALSLAGACASGNTGGEVDASDPIVGSDAAGPDASVDATPPDAGPKVRTCEACDSNVDCPDTHQCVTTGGGKVCLERCTPEEPDCPDDFMCGGVETTYCAPIDGLCCVDNDDDSYGVGIACVGPDCNDSDGTINPGAPDVCNGVDDDCLPASPDGTDDPALGDDCDGPDTDLCKEGVRVCTLGSLTCTDDTDDEIDVCDGIDNDCNPGTLDGSGEAIVGTACDSPADPDLCTDDQYVCNSSTGEVVCEDMPASAVDLCDGLDNDCDPSTPDGSGDPGVGVACDGGDTDLCKEGTTFCSGGAILCGDATDDAVDVCDGIDNDCDPSTPDGSGDPSVGETCDGGDTDLCEEGLRLCSVGVLVCTDTSGDNQDVCNGLDDDCNPATPDGAHDTGVGVVCDGGDGDLCNEGFTFCDAGGTIACDDTTGTNPDLCNGVDDDCNPATADGADEATLGDACDGGDSDLCDEGTMQCSSGSMTCTDTTGDNAELCNGVDDDCNPATADGADEATLGDACDGPDTDLCAEGTRQCSAGAMGCTDLTGNNAEVCDGLDNDCNGSTADGSGDPLVGLSCDGGDGDLCAEGFTFCTGGGSIACNDVTGTNVELCNGVDDDCNPATADGSGDTGVGLACDGADSDLCQEGTTFCTAGGSISCDDTTSGNAELCNGADDDCNPGTVDGSGDPLLGTSCDGTDGDLCEEGSRICTGGALVCTDATGTLVDICNGTDDDCDLSVDEVPAGVTCPTQHTGAINVGTWTCSGGCGIGSCAGNNANFDGLVPNGCECALADTFSNTCGGATSAPNVALGGVVDMTGHIESATDSDYIEFTFTPRAAAVGATWNPTITLLPSAGDQFILDLFNGSCGALGCETGTSVATKSWGMNYSYGTSNPTDIPAKTTTVIVRVRRRLGDAPTCTTYTVRATNP
jgi:hypothetical protein